MRGRRAGSELSLPPRTGHGLLTVTRDALRKCFLRGQQLLGAISERGLGVPGCAGREGGGGKLCQEEAPSCCFRHTSCTCTCTALSDGEEV